jgi:chromate transporter
MEERPHVPFREAFAFWVKLGFISFGGPAGQIALMHRELVEKRKWISEERFLHALNYCMILPGPEAQQLAIYNGWLFHGTLGGVIAGAFFVIPSFFILLLLSYIYVAYGNVPLIAGVLDGFKAVVVAVVIEAVIKIAGRALKTKISYAFAVGAFAAIYFLSVPFPLIVLAAAIAGIVISRRAVPADRPETVTAPDPTEKVRSRSTIAIIALGLVLWAIPFAVVLAVFGGGSLFAQEYRFFSISALVTFGGAYAVLAYVSQAVTVAPYNWITPVQAVDGLALAETTPGPLIMVLQFVGFMAGWNNPVFGLSPLESGVIGAMIATYTTFLPSFIFIFAGAPYIERLRNNAFLNGALTGVTAAVVGVILNLALVFGSAVLLPNGIAGGLNWFAAGLAVLSFIALVRFKIDPMWVVLAAGVVGFFFAMVAS